jgi:hypothetical protein
MPDVQQLGFDLREITRLLIREAKITEGIWYVGFEFNFGGGNIGQSPSELRPGGIILINKLLLVRHVDPTLAPPPFALDAAGVNPARAPTSGPISSGPVSSGPLSG